MNEIEQWLAAGNQIKKIPIMVVDSYTPLTSRTSKSMGLATDIDPMPRVKRDKTWAQIEKENRLKRESLRLNSIKQNKTPEEKNQYNKEWQKRNKDKYEIYQKRYRQKQKEKLLCQQ